MGVQRQITWQLAWVDVYSYTQDAVQYFVKPVDFEVFMVSFL